MRTYWIRTHWLIRKLLPHYWWQKDPSQRTVYLTFDDGPIPEVTDFVLQQLELFNAKATFFCIGDNIQKHPELFQRLIASGHSIGNHTFNHLNGWKTSDKDYLENVEKCRLEIEKHIIDRHKLMRPPYAKATLSQSRKLRKLGYTIVMWDVLSADFDQQITPEKCLENVLKNIRPGSIVIFHDSRKAFQNMSYALTKTLLYLKENNYECKRLY